MLVNHVLKHLEDCLDTKKMFKLTTSVKIYDGVVLIAKEWDQVPRQVVLNGCPKSGILAPYQEMGLQDLKTGSVGQIKCALRPQVGTVFETDRMFAETSSQEAKCKGREYMN